MNEELVTELAELLYSWLDSEYGYGMQPADQDCLAALRKAGISEERIARLGLERTK